jgi:hypothetical protein
MARCTRPACRRWYPEVLLRFGAGVHVEDGWYCCRECLQRAVQERLERLSRTAGGSAERGANVRLGALLVAGDARLSPELLARALQAQRTSKRKLGAELLQMGAITQAELVTALARQASTKCLTTVDPAIARAGHGGLSRDMVRALGLVPFAARLEARLLKVAFAAPLPRAAMAALRELTGWTPDPYLVADDVFPLLVEAYATGSTDERVYTTAEAATFEDGLAQVARLAERGRAARISHARLDSQVWVRVEASGHVDDVLMAAPDVDEETIWQTAPTLH